MNLDFEKAAAILRNVGGKTFGQPQIAEEAASEFIALVQNEPPVVVAWDVFMELLLAYEQQREAFSAAWPQDGVVPYAISRGLALQDAEEVSQQTALAAWSNFTNFRPYRSQWSTWLLVIARGKIIDDWRRRQRWQVVEIEERHMRSLLYVTPEGCNCQEREATLRVVSRWLASKDKRVQRFAGKLLESFQNLSEFFPTSREVMRDVGVSKTTAFRWFQKFAEEARAEIEMQKEGEENATRR